MFAAPTASEASFALCSVAGRYVLLGFLPVDADRRDQALATVARHRALFDDDFAMCFLVVRDDAAIAQARDTRGLRWFIDRDGAVSRQYGALSDAGDDQPLWVILDPTMRILGLAPMDQAEAVMARLRGLPAPDDHVGVVQHAPVLIVPRVLEPDLCRRLIDYYEEVGGQPSGVMREVGGRTVGVLDDFKKRRDAIIEDETLQVRLRTSIHHRLAPEIARAFQFQATRIERYIVACYDAQGGGYFRPHKDNTTAGTAHRKFAVTINLNAEAYEGGDLRFPEFGRRTYRAPTGGAVVFSCSLLHEATPITRGRRYAYLPFLYDEEGAALRTRNRHLVEGPIASETTAQATVGAD
jgi:predicted 2-oxoglutarate/Fe(II)-dependent dioxygenase YbiX